MRSAPLQRHMRRSRPVSTAARARRTSSTSGAHGAAGRATTATLRAAGRSQTFERAQRGTTPTDRARIGRRRCAHSSPRCPSAHRCWTTAPAAAARRAAAAWTLTTVHQAKGLEWAAVVLPALEDGIFPHARGAREAARAAAALDCLREEQRLLYVGVTRAKEHLVMTRAAERGGAPTRPCPFLRALPTEDCEAIAFVDADGAAAIAARAPRPSAAEAAVIDGSEAARRWQAALRARWTPRAVARRRGARFLEEMRRARARRAGGGVGGGGDENAAGGGDATVDQPASRLGAARGGGGTPRSRRRRPLQRRQPRARRDATLGWRRRRRRCAGCGGATGPRPLVGRRGPRGGRRRQAPGGPGWVQATAADPASPVVILPITVSSTRKYAASTRQASSASRRTCTPPSPTPRRGPPSART